MEKYTELKKIIVNVLEQIPLPLIDEASNDIYAGYLYEFTEPREYTDVVADKKYTSREIGASNIYTALIFVSRYMTQFEGNDSAENHTDVLTAIFKELEEERLIREIPEIKRKKIKLVVDNT